MSGIIILFICISTLVFCISFFSKPVLTVKNRKHRIIQVTKQNGKSDFYIQQFSNIYRKWYKTLDPTSFDVLVYNSSDGAKTSLQFHINKYQKQKDEISGEKIVEIKTIAITEKI